MQTSQFTLKFKFLVQSSREFNTFN